MTTISVVGGTNVYIQQTGGNIESSTDLTNWTVISSFPITINNTLPGSGIVTVIFISDIILTSSNQYFICGSSDIQFGNTTRNNDGSRAVITINGVSGYPGLINNGTSGTGGYNNINIYNIFVNSSGSTLANGGGWIGQTFYCGAALNNSIINCSSNGTISVSGGGIVGSSATTNGGNLIICECTSSGNILNGGGGITGASAANTTGSTIEFNRCSSTGLIDIDAGGISGFFSAVNGGILKAINCYSTGNITGGGGILGWYAGTSGSVECINCYSSGNINSGGGIFGRNAGNSFGIPGLVKITNSYSTGSIGNFSGGIFAIDYGVAIANNCYTSGQKIAINSGGIWAGSSSDSLQGANNYAESNHSSSGWDTARANNVLTGVPVTSNYGITWSSIGVGLPYVLSLSGYTPYSLSLVETASSSIKAGKSTSAPVVPGYTYSLLDVVPLITIDSITGVISTDPKLKPGTYILYIYSSINPYSVTIYSLIITADSAIIATPCCALPTDLPNFDYTTRYAVITGNAVLADNYRRGPYPDYSFYYTRKMAAASKR
jgi:hypothetical protein